MEAKELRIGNLIGFNNHLEPQKIITVTPRWFSSLAGGRPEQEQADINQELNAYWSGIPLTEEWLTKFGFNSKYKSVHVQWHRNYGPGVVSKGLTWYGSFYIQQVSDVDDDNNQIEQKQEFYYYSSEVQIDVKTVHQLQNLYFTLTQEELTIK